MPPRPYQPTAPRTAAARAATSAFHCSLCRKGYSRQNDYDTHLSSYEHTHAQRLIDMKKLTADPRAAEKQARAERRANKDLVRVEGMGGVTTISSGGGFTKIQDLAKQGEREAKVVSIVDRDAPMTGFTKIVAEVEKKDEGNAEEDDDLGYEYYDPSHPTECGSECEGWCGKMKA